MEEKKPLERIKESGGGVEVGNEEDDLVFPGFRFHPTDQELVGFYLTRKVEKKGFSIDIIKEIDIYKHDPWDLPNEGRQVVQGAGDMDWYFFCLRGRKYRNSIRPNRVTGSGFWKATGIDKPIHGGGAGAECLGLKKSLVYYRGSAGRGTKTDWMMHEFRLPSTSSTTASAADLQDAEIWTICRIFKRNMTHNRRCQQKQEHASKRSHQQQQQYYYDYGYLQQQSEAYTTDHRQPFLLHGFHGVSSAITTRTTTSGLTGAPLPPSTSSGWSEPMTFRDSSISTWDELGRIMEV